MYTVYREVTSVFDKPTSLGCGRPALLQLSSDLLNVLRQLELLAIVREMGYKAAQSLVAFIHFTFIDWPVLVTVNPGDIRLVYYNLEIGLATMPLLPAVRSVKWPTLIFGAASRLVEEYFGSMARPLGHVRGAVFPIATVKVSGSDTVL